MNARFSEIKNTKLQTSNGVVGTVVDLLVDDKHWMVRYLVVATPTTSNEPSKRVLVSPAAISDADIGARVITTALDSEHILASPSLDEAKSISRQYELALAEHYGWPIYWLGQTVVPPQTLDHFATDADTVVEKDGESNLRSADEICGYQIRSRNGKAGVMQDLVINTRIWRVDNGVAESRTWLPLESSMFLTRHIQSVNWSRREITVDLSREALLTQHAATPAFSQLSQLTSLFNVSQRSV